MIESSAIDTAPAMIFKPQLKEVKYNESMKPNSGFRSGHACSW